MEKHQTILDKAFRERKWEVQLIFFNGYYFNRNRRKERGREGGRGRGEGRKRGRGGDGRREGKEWSEGGEESNK